MMTCLSPRITSTCGMPVVGQGVRRYRWCDKSEKCNFSFRSRARRRRLRSNNPLYLPAASAHLAPRTSSHRISPASLLCAVQCSVVQAIYVPSLSTTENGKCGMSSCTCFSLKCLPINRLASYTLGGARQVSEQGMTTRSAQIFKSGGEERRRRKKGKRREEEDDELSKDTMCANHAATQTSNNLLP